MVQQNMELTWREETVIRILLFVAALIAQDEKTQGEIKSLCAHIQYGPRLPVR